MNGLDLIRATLAEWRKNRGNETTFYKCQHFDGWYVQWALQGFRDDRSIRVYSTAQIAADASPIFTRQINDKSIQAGDRLYFRYGVPGHIVTAIGWDGDRLLVSNTANGGDTVIALTNNVKIHHADTIDLPFIGASRQNGSNRAIRVENYIHGAGSPAGNPQPTGDTRQWIDLTNWYWYTNPGDAQAKRNYRKPLLQGRYPVIGRDANGAVQVLSNSLGRIWVHSSALGGAPVPAPAPAPAGGTQVRLGGERWYWYLSADDAGAMRNVQGKRRGQIMLEGNYPIIGRAGNGAIQVLSRSMGRVWLHPSARSKVG